METKATFEEFKGHPVLVVRSLTEKGKDGKGRVLVSFGTKKAQYILNHIEDVKKFIETPAPVAA